MSGILARHTKHCQLFIWAVNLTTVTALVTGQVQEARSTIFEQTNSGQMIEVAGGVFGIPLAILTAIGGLFMLAGAGMVMA